MNKQFNYNFHRQDHLSYLWKLYTITGDEHIWPFIRFRL